MISSLDLTPDADEASAHLVTTVRSALEDMLLLEYRLATLASVIERFGTRHIERAVTEMQAAVEKLTVTEKQRQVGVAALAEALGISPTLTFVDVIDLAPPGVRGVLTGARADMLGAKRRIDVLVARAEDLLGRRIALVTEVLGSTAEAEESTYGRSARPRPKFVDGLL
jgi:hypothetical protein